MVQVVSTCLAGAAFGSLAGAKLASQYGRKGTLLLDVIPLFMGPFLCATANSLNWIIAGRVITGIGIGLVSGLVPLFISEVCVQAFLLPPACRASQTASAVHISIHQTSAASTQHFNITIQHSSSTDCRNNAGGQIAPPEVRGMLGSLNQLTICIGILGALVVNVLMPPTAWRAMFWLATIPAALLALGICWFCSGSLPLGTAHCTRGVCFCYDVFVKYCVSSTTRLQIPRPSRRFAVCAGEPAVAVCKRQEHGGAERGGVAVGPDRSSTA